MFGLRGKLILAFAMLTCLTMICAGIVIHSMNRSVASFDHVAGSALPSLRIAERLARHSERATAQIAQLFAVRSAADQDQLRLEWESIEFALNAALTGARKLASPLAEIDDLTTRILQIKAARERLDEAVGQRMFMTAQQNARRASLLQASRKFQDILEPLIAIAEWEQVTNQPPSSLDNALITDPSPIEPAAGLTRPGPLTTLLRLRQMTSDIVTRLLAVGQERRPQHLQLAVIRTRSHVDRVRALLSTLDHDAGLYLAELTDQILTSGSGPIGLPALRQKALANENLMTSLKAAASLHIRQLETITNGLVRDTSRAFDLDRQAFHETQRQMSFLVLAAAALSVLATLGIGVFYVQDRMVHPILALSQAVKSFEQGQAFDLDVKRHRDEIGQLGRAFVHMAESRRHAETALAERNHLLAATNGELERANVELERSNQELESFASIAAHDLKEPLRAIRNHAQFLIEDHAQEIGDGGAKRLDRLVALGGRMDRLINDLLYYARLGRQEQTVEPIDLPALIADIEVDLADALKARDARIILQDGLPAIEGNSLQIATVFRNLISNATKYNDEAEKRVEIGIDPEAEQDPSMTTFYVRDNGVGIEKDLQAAAFKMFKRLHPRSAYGEGTGAGLSFVKKIVENQGGSIWLSSIPGQGTTFFLTLRRYPGETRA